MFVCHFSVCSGLSCRCCFANLTFLFRCSHCSHFNLFQWPFRTRIWILYFVLCTTGYFAFHSHTIITHSEHEKQIVFTWCFHVHFFQLNVFCYALLLFTLFLSAAFIYFRAHTHTKLFIIESWACSGTSIFARFFQIFRSFCLSMLSMFVLCRSHAPLHWWWVKL